MESHHMLSPQQYQFLKSQKTLSENFNKSENLKRIKKTVEKALETFDIILSSSVLDQTYLNELFPHYEVSNFITKLTRYDTVHTISQENNKLEIARTMITYGLIYYQTRFKKTQFFSKKINEIQDLLIDLNEIANAESQDSDAMNFYRMRFKLRYPPDIRPSELEYYAVCMICWRYHSAEIKKLAIKSIRHEKNCVYKKELAEQCIKIIPPKEKS